jgi:hypothetical protein
VRVTKLDPQWGKPIGGLVSQCTKSSFWQGRSTRDLSASLGKILNAPRPKSNQSSNYHFFHTFRSQFRFVCTIFVCKHANYATIYLLTDNICQYSWFHFPKIFPIVFTLTIFFSQKGEITGDLTLLKILVESPWTFRFEFFANKSSLRWDCVILSTQIELCQRVCKTKSLLICSWRKVEL